MTPNLTPSIERDPLSIAMDDLAHVLMCGELSGDCESCAAARERVRQYREAQQRYPHPGVSYQVKTEKSKAPGKFWIAGRRVLRVDMESELPIVFQHAGSKTRGRCTLERWNKWAKNAEVIEAAE